MKGLIIAAGQGTRLKEKGDSKPLTPLLDIPLIERVITSAYQGGVDSFVVVTGYQRAQLESFLEDLSLRTQIAITPLYNEAWQQENGLSVLKAAEVLKEPFVLMMSDHMFDYQIITRLLRSHTKTLRDETYLCVDNQLDNPLVDLEDVTKVKAQNGLIQNIGKEIESYNCFDTGIFLCSPTIFEALERSSKCFHDTSLSGAMRVLSAEGRARTFDISGSFWIDVDDSAAYLKAETYLRQTVFAQSTL